LHYIFIISKCIIINILFIYDTSYMAISALNISCNKILKNNFSLRNSLERLADISSRLLTSRNTHTDLCKERCCCVSGSFNCDLSAFLHPRRARGSAASLRVPERELKHDARLFLVQTHLRALRRAAPHNSA